MVLLDSQAIPNALRILKMHAEVSHQNSRQRRQRARRDRQNASFSAIPQEVRDSSESQLPRAIDVNKFAAARAREINLLRFAVEQGAAGGAGQRAYQSLPKHLRRRNASHNVYRIPSRLRSRARREQTASMAGSKLEPGTAKRPPNRRNRRRKAALLSSEAQDKRKFKWLETHIWHAKRMKMDDRWGYRIALHPNDKGQRATYRATSTFCTIFDASYFAPVRLTGTVDAILGSLKDFVAPGDIEGKLRNMRFCGGDRHASFIMHEAGKWPLDSLGPVNFLWNPASTEKVHTSPRKLMLWMHPSSYATFCEQWRAINASNSSILLSQLKDSLLRFELRGRKTQSILQRVLRSKPESSTSHRVFEQLMSLGSPSAIPSCIVICLKVESPSTFRISRDVTCQPRSLPCGSDGIQTLLLDWPGSVTVASTSLWDIEEMSSSVIDGAVEVMLLHQPGFSMGDFSCGWDIIMPAGVGRDFWTNFSLAQARAVGWDDRLQQYFEEARPTFPDHFLDAASGRKHAEMKQQLAIERHLSKPVGKRINFSKLNIDGPFELPLKDAFASSGTSSPFELRNVSVVRDPDLLLKLSSSQVCSEALSKVVATAWKNAVVFVSICMTGKGVPHDLARLFASERDESPGALIGAVVHGRVSFLRGCGFGIGWVTLHAFLNILPRPCDAKWHVHVRNLTSTASHKAIMTIGKPF